jgi:hypothetical protein
LFLLLVSSVFVFLSFIQTSSSCFLLATERAREGGDKVAMAAARWREGCDDVGLG